MVNISNKIVFNYSEPNENPLHCDCSWTYRCPWYANNWVRYYPGDYLIKNEYLIKYQEQTFWECKDYYIENENERGKYLYKQDPIWKDGVKYGVDVFCLSPWWWI